MTSSSAAGASAGDDFQRQGKLVFMVHGIVLGLGLAIMLPDLPAWLISADGREWIGGAAASIALGLVMLKLVVGRRWPQVGGAFSVVAGGWTLGACSRTGFSGSPVELIVGSSLLFAGLLIIARQSKVRAEDTEAMDSRVAASPSRMSPEPAGEYARCTGMS